MSLTSTDPDEFILLRTVHGSRLYGLANPLTSDYDLYVVVANGHKRAVQTIEGVDDVMVLTLNEFAKHVWKGVPQALEALYSPAAQEAPLDAYRHRFYTDTARTTATYRRTIKSFALGGTVKLRRHALRLSVNLRDIHTYGQFSPVLAPAVAADITAAANGTPDEYLDALRTLAPVDPFEDKPQFHEVLRASFQDAN